MTTLLSTIGSKSGALFFLFYLLAFGFSFSDSDNLGFSPALLIFFLILFFLYLYVEEKRTSLWITAIGILFLLAQNLFVFFVSSMHAELESLAWTFLWLLLGQFCLAWVVLKNTVRLKKIMPHIVRFLTPVIAGIFVILCWENVIVGFRVPFVLLPAPSRILNAILSNSSLLWLDFIQTFIRSVIPGYIIGCAAGFGLALLADKISFLKKGLLPFGNFVSALPIVGTAPIMIMWFGFDWQSKAAVVVIITFFPMLANSIVGLDSSKKYELDLLDTYSPSYLQKMFKVRLPNASPFLFNALKINSTLALIGAIVSEFFGTPIVGMGFRISTEVGRMNLDIVWATIIVSAVLGSLVYASIAFLEKVLNFWHESIKNNPFFSD